MQIQKDVIFTFKANKIIDEIGELNDAHREVIELFKANDVNMHNDYITKCYNGDNKLQVMDEADNILIDLYSEGVNQLDIIKGSLVLV